MSLRLLNGLLVMLVRMSYTSSEVTQTYSMCSTARLLDMNGTNMQQNWSNSSKEKTNNQEESWFPTPVIDCHSLTWLPTKSEAPSINPRSRVFSSRFLGASRFPWRASLFLAILLSWRFAFPGDSSVLAVRVSWRFPCPGDSPVLAIPNTSWRAVVWSYFNFNSKSVPGCFWCPRAV